MMPVIAIAAALAEVIVNPTWVERPSGEMLDEPMPPFATLIDVDANVVLDCVTLPRLAAPQRCEVISTTVTGLGFEAKAIEMAATGLNRQRCPADGSHPVHDAVPGGGLEICGAQSLRRA
jgi:hypothetical protein